MNIKSLTLKNILKDENNEEYFDFSVPCFDLSSTSISTVHVVTQDEEGRIDKICQKYYSCTDYIDLLCFANRIYNPFSIKKDDLLVIPYVTSITNKIYYKPTIPEWITGQNSSGNPKAKTNERDENRINRLKQQKAPRKPNELPEGKSAKKYVNGKVILGTHLSTNNG